MILNPLQLIGVVFLSHTFIHLIGQFLGFGRSLGYMLIIRVGAGSVFLYLIISQ